jgi:hypothetical protein
MKVIKKGRPQKGWAAQFTCTGESDTGGGCGAVLLVEQDDIYTFMTGGSYCENADETNYAFTCSECGVETVVKSNRHGWKKPKDWPNLPTHLDFVTRETWEKRTRKQKQKTSGGTLGFD